MARLVAAIWTLGSVATANALARPLSRTPAQVEVLLSEAAEFGFVEREQDRWTLTDEGGALATSVTSELEATFRASTESFRSYRGYVPRRWYPD